MTITPKEKILLIKKHKNTALKADIALEEDDGDKRLVTGEVIAGSEDFVGKTIIFGKYALYSLVIQGEEFHLLEEEDVIGTCDYKE